MSGKNILIWSAFTLCLTLGFTLPEPDTTQWILQTSESQTLYSIIEQESDWQLDPIFKSLGVYRLSYQGNREVLHVEKIIRTVRQARSTMWFQADRRVETRTTFPNDPLFVEQWNMNRIDMPQAWDITTGGVTRAGDTIVIAVLDEGFDLTHEDITENLWRNHAEIPNDGIDNDGNSYIDDYLGVHLQTGADDHPVHQHGINVCGIIGANGNNDQFVSGVNWNVKMMLVSKIAFESNIIEGYEYVHEMRKKYNDSNGSQGAFVVATNLSAGIDKAFAEDHPIWCQIYEMLGEEGVLNVAATTNKNFDVEVEGDMPTTCTSQYLVSVTNVNEDDVKVTNAGYGAISIDLGAPGNSTLTTHLNNSTKSFPGTSASTPHVAGVVGLMYAAACTEVLDEMRTNPSSTAISMKNILLDAVDANPSLENITSTGGRLNAFGAIRGLAEVCGSSAGELGITNIFPNPTDDGNITIEYQAPDNEPVTIKVIDVLGREVFSREVNDPLFSAKRISIINRRVLPTGIYIAVIQRKKEAESAKFFVW